MNKPKLYYIIARFNQKKKMRSMYLYKSKNSNLLCSFSDEECERYNGHFGYTFWKGKNAFETLEEAKKALRNILEEERMKLELKVDAISNQLCHMDAIEIVHINETADEIMKR